MLDMFTRGLLEKKYAQQDEQNAINRLQAQNMGMLQAAQANNLNVTAGLAPRIFDSEDSFRQANTRQVNLQNQFYPRLTELSLTTGMVNNDFTRARIGETRAQTGLLGAQTRNINDMQRRTGLGLADLFPTLRSRFSEGMP